MEIKPFGHSERKTNKLHYEVVDLSNEIPRGNNSVIIFWRVPFLNRLKLLFFGKLQTSFMSRSVPPIRLEIL